MSLNQINVNNTTVANVDNLPINESENLVKSYGIYDQLIDTNTYEDIPVDPSHVGYYISEWGNIQRNGTNPYWYSDPIFVKAGKIIKIDICIDYNVPPFSRSDENLTYTNPLVEIPRINRDGIAYYFVKEDMYIVISGARYGSYKRKYKIIDALDSLGKTAILNSYELLEIPRCTPTGNYMDTDGTIRHNGSTYYVTKPIFCEANCLYLLTMKVDNNVVYMSITDENASYYKPLHLINENKQIYNKEIRFKEDTYIVLSGQSHYQTYNFKKIKKEYFTPNRFDITSKLEKNSGYWIGDDGYIHSGDIYAYTKPLFFKAGTNIHLEMWADYSVVEIAKCYSEDSTYFIPLVNTYRNAFETIDYFVDEDCYISFSTYNSTKMYLELILEIDEPTNIEHDICNAIVNNTKENTILIPCWGDSLTHANSSQPVRNINGFAGLMQNALGDDYKIINCGVGGETLQTISARQGCMPMFTKTDFTIPSTITTIDLGSSPFVNAESEQRGINPLGQGDGNSINPVYINGLSCRLSKDTNGYHLTRSAAGDSVVVKAGTLISTFGSREYKNCNAIVIWIGTNGSWPSSMSKSEYLISVCKKYKDYCGTPNFIVIGLHTLSVSDSEEMERALTSEFGFHFINWKRYALEQGLSDADITPTTQDQQDIQNGIIPTSLRTDSVHLNSRAYVLLARLILERLEYLNVIPKLANSTKELVPIYYHIKGTTSISSVTITFTSNTNTLTTTSDSNGKFDVTGAVIGETYTISCQNYTPNPTSVFINWHKEITIDLS